MTTVTAHNSTTSETTARAAPTPPFGVNELRLSATEWIWVIAIVSACAVVIPRAWRRFETFSPGPDYRIPYALSKDYWLWQRRLEAASRPDQVVVLGDSVVWGEYVRPDGTLTHFLNQSAGAPDRFVNCGVNGLFPLALEGLVRDYATALRSRKVIVHCNMLWISSPEADLSTHRAVNFNHSRIVPQLSTRIPCYGADANERLSAAIEPHVEFFKWINHLQSVYYDQKSVPMWTLADNGRDPPGYPNAWRSPFAPLANGIPGEPPNDLDRGPSSARHKPWNQIAGRPTDFEWVDLESSLQWKAFQRLIALLRERGNDVIVVLGPFNEHMIAADQRPEYQLLRDRISAALHDARVPALVPHPLATDLYADASHPLTRGYAALAGMIFDDAAFQKWLLRNVDKP
jgi:hypothetical protein